MLETELEKANLRKFFILGEVFKKRMFDRIRIISRILVSCICDAGDRWGMAQEVRGSFLGIPLLAGYGEEILVGLMKEMVDNEIYLHIKGFTMRMVIAENCRRYSLLADCDAIGRATEIAGRTHTIAKDLQIDKFLPDPDRWKEH